MAIVGSGFAGLGMAIRLREAGIDDFVVLEKADDVGGTWRDNSYPGCACDVPSHLYSFSFAPNPEWTSTFSPQPEIRDYLRGCAERYGVMPHVRFGHELLDAAWDEDAQRWRLETSQRRPDRAGARARHRPAQRAVDPRPAGPRALRGRRPSTRPPGTTTTTSTASAWP